MERPDSVEIATPADIPGLFWFCIGDMESDNSLRVPVSERKTLDTVMELCRGERGIAGVVHGPHGPIASIGIRPFQPWFSEQWILSQVWLFVVPSARKQNAKLADDLFQFAEWHREYMSREVGYEVVFENSVYSLDRLEAKERLWRRYGERIGAIFWTRGKPNGQGQHIDEHE